MLQANQRRMLGWTRESVYVHCTQCQTVQFSEHAGNYWKTELTYSCTTVSSRQMGTNSSSRQSSTGCRSGYRIGGVSGAFNMILNRCSLRLWPRPLSMRRTWLTTMRIPTSQNSTMYNTTMQNSTTYNSTRRILRRRIGASTGVSTPSASDRRFQQPVREPRMAPHCSCSSVTAIN